MVVCALIGHLWMHTEPALPEAMGATAAAPADSAHSDGAEDAHDHAMALTCMAVLAAGALLVRRWGRVALAAAPFAGFATDLAAQRAVHPQKPSWSPPDRVAAGITLLV